MPELPEVETIRRGLEQGLPGRRVERAEVRCDRVLLKPDAPTFERELRGQVFREPQRHGKLLILPLERHTLLVHLGMTGQITLRDPSRPDRPFERLPVTGLQRTTQHAVDAHTHIVLHLEGGHQLMYRDIRKFGKWRLYRPQELSRAPELKRLGPDPFTPAYQLESFQDAMKRTRRSVKSALLDQGVVAGVGNIYADEALYRSGIRPTRRGVSLTRAELARLFTAVREVLELGISNRGTTFSNYRDAEGRSGSNQASLQAYGRYGQECYGCGGQLQRSTVGQRTTTWCPRCQR